ncbi:MAG: SDR family oxidoreductase [Pseudomonadota bacterium]
MELAGKKVVIFGGTSGIGLAAAKQIVAEGASVIAISRDPSKAGTLPAGITTEACDTTDGPAVEALLAKLAPYDVLISAATGGDRAVGPFMTMDIEGFKGSFAKMWGYANVVRYGTQHLPEEGRIVLVSGAPPRNMRPGQIAIASVGGAVEAFARGIAKEIAPRRINVVAPGTIDTPMVAMEGDARTTFYNNATKGNLIARAGKPEEVAEGIVFAVKNDFITGTTVDVDGGWLLT